MRFASFAVFCVFVVGCPANRDSGEGEGDSGEGEGEGVFAVSSPDFEDGGAFPLVSTCDGDDTSPALTFDHAPAGTAGFGVVFTDLDNGLIHTTMWDVANVAGTAAGLPAGVDNEFSPADVDGAHQSLGYDGVTRGWLGPCPPSAHTYEFVVYAVDTRPLPDLDATSERDDVKAALEASALGTASLRGVYDPAR